MRRGCRGCTRTAQLRTKMSGVSARRALIRTVRRRHPDEASNEPPPVFWGRIGAYEGVTRQGILFLLAPDPVHPARRVRSGA